MNRACRWLVPALALVLVSCDGSKAPASDPPPPRVTSAAADGMCAEHGVLEAVCTKCNAGLVPIFKDKGDWCAEHGFPESFCPTCHPERGGRPAADVGGELPSAEDAIDGTRILFRSDESAALAGIETEPARAAAATGGLIVPGTIVADASRVASVNARASGILRQVLAEVGTTVRKGDALAILASPDAAASLSRVEMAQARLRATRAEHERVQKLLDARIASERELIAARRDLDEVEAQLAAARAEAGPLGAIGAGGVYTLRAPMDGLVLERAASVGQLIHPDEALFTLVDARQLWVELDVPERQLAGVSIGSGAEVALIDGQRLVTRIDHISPIIDPATRTARARGSLPNADGRIRINSRVRVSLLDSGSNDGARSVSTRAVQRIGEHDVVFVRLGPAQFELKRVEVLSRVDDLATVRGGIEPGDELATVGSFLLKTEILKASIGSGCCEVE